MKLVEKNMPPWHPGGRIVCSLICGLSLLTMLAFGNRAHADTLNDKQKKQVEKIIADWLIKNPEALADSLSNMQKHFEQAEEKRVLSLLKSNRNEVYRNKSDFALGKKTAPITIIEFFDYNCGYCKRAFAPLMKVANKSNDIRVVFKEFPILSPTSRKAAEYALALDDNLHYITFHTKLMNHRGNISDAVLSKTLVQMNIDEAELLQKISKNRKKIDAHLQSTSTLARRLGINGTPGFIINDEIYAGALDKDELNAAIASARKKLKK